LSHGMKLLVVNYHYMGSKTFPFKGIYPCSSKKFKKQINILAKQCEFISSEDLYQHYTKGKKLPKKSCLITFDDGLKEQYEIGFSILEKHGIPSIFFINTSSLASNEAQTVHKIHWLRSKVKPNVLIKELRECAASNHSHAFENLKSYKQAAKKQYRYDKTSDATLKYVLNFVLPHSLSDIIISTCFNRIHPNASKFASNLYLDKRQIKKLARKSALGLHSHTHLPLATLKASEIYSEIDTCRKVIKSITGIAPSIISYPYGGKTAVSPAVQKMARKAGVKLGFTMNRDINTAKTNPLMLNRFDTNDIKNNFNYFD